MKLFIKETCVVKGGKIVEAGQVHDTGDVDRKADREAFDLISTGRAVQHSDTAAVEEAKEQIANAKEAKAKAKKASEKDEESDPKGKK